MFRFFLQCTKEESLEKCYWVEWSLELNIAAGFSMRAEQCSLLGFWSPGKGTRRQVGLPSSLVKLVQGGRVNSQFFCGFLKEKTFCVGWKCSSPDFQSPRKLQEGWQGCLAVGGAAFFVRDSLGFFGDLDMEQDARCCWPPPEWCIRCFLCYEPGFFNFILPFLLFSLFRVYFEQLLKVWCNRGQLSRFLTVSLVLFSLFFSDTCWPGYSFCLSRSLCCCWCCVTGVFWLQAGTSGVGDKYAYFCFCFSCITQHVEGVGCLHPPVTNKVWWSRKYPGFPQWKSVFPLRRSRRGNTSL